MRRKWMSLVVLGLSIGVMGCSRNAVPVETDAAKMAEKLVKESDDKESAEDVLAGVYLNGGDIKEVEMGTYYDDVQKKFCRIKMPSDYLFGVSYTDEEGERVAISDLENDSIQDVIDAIDTGTIEGAENAFSAIYLRSLKEDSSNLNFLVRTSDSMTLNDLKERYPDGSEFGTEEQPAYYYVDPDEYADTDLCIGYQINENILLTMTYSGPLDEELGLEQLAQNMYDLVEVIE